MNVVINNPFTALSRITQKEFAQRNESNMERALNLVRDTARDAVHFRSRTGRLEDSIQSEMISGLEGSVFINERIAPYGPGIHNGTGIYGESGQETIIESRTTGAMRWVDESGNQHFASRVVNPGFEGQPFLDDALEQHIELIDDIFAQGLEDIIGEEF